MHVWHLALYKGMFIRSVIKRHKEHSLFKGSVLSIGGPFCKALSTCSVNLNAKKCLTLKEILREIKISGRTENK